MKVTPLQIPEILLVEPKVFGDARGYFVETFQAERYAQAGISARFVQDNLSRSSRGTLRGLHLQYPNAQAKLVYVVEGEVFDVAVDVRVGSPSFGKWTGAHLSARDHRQMYIPPGFAHGFCVKSEHALFAYKCSDIYLPQHEWGWRGTIPHWLFPGRSANRLSARRTSASRLWPQIDPARLPPWKG
jgi:dTDP-4-dehydrorhamnose 3,5-epimerase